MYLSIYNTSSYPWYDDDVVDDDVGVTTCWSMTSYPHCLCREASVVIMCILAVRKYGRRIWLMVHYNIIFVEPEQFHILMFIL